MRVSRGLEFGVWGAFTICGFPSRVTMVLRGMKDTGRTIDLQRDRTSMLNLRTGEVGMKLLVMDDSESLY